MEALFQDTISPSQTYINNQSTDRAQGLFADWLAQQVTLSAPLTTTTLPNTSFTSATAFPQAAPWSAFHSSTRCVSPLLHDDPRLSAGPSTVSDHTESSSHHSQSEPEHDTDTKDSTQTKRVSKRRPRIMTDKRREQNRVAQRNLRARRQQEVTEHQQQVGDLENVISDLRLALATLRRENDQLKVNAAATAHLTSFSLL